MLAATRKVRTKMRIFMDRQCALIGVLAGVDKKR